MHAGPLPHIDILAEFLEWLYEDKSLVLVSVSEAFPAEIVEEREAAAEFVVEFLRWRKMRIRDHRNERLQVCRDEQRSAKMGC